MLEQQIAREMVASVLKAAASAGVIRVTSAKLTVGAMRPVEEGELKAQIAAAARGTDAEGMQVEVVRAPAVMRCTQCGHEYSVTLGKPETYDCPACGGARHDVVSGMEINISDLMGLQPSDSIVDKLEKAVADKFGPLGDAPAGEGAQA